MKGYTAVVWSVLPQERACENPVNINGLMTTMQKSKGYTADVGHVIPQEGGHDILSKVYSQMTVGQNSIGVHCSGCVFHTNSETRLLDSF